MPGNTDILPKLPIRNFRKYYSDRIVSDSQKNWTIFLQRFSLLYMDFKSCGYFAEALGNWCIDGDHTGSVGEHQFFFNDILARPHFYPIEENIKTLKQADIFDLIEILYDLVSKPTDGHYHAYNDCGWHFNEFDHITGKQVFRERINELFEIIGNEYFLDKTGEVSFAGNVNLKPLLDASLHHEDKTNVNLIVEAAVQQFKNKNSTNRARREAVRKLADVLEYLRPKAKRVLKKSDENDLFNIANGFGIRHHNQNQKVDYDEPIWLSWMFYFYLATIHAVTRLIEKET